MHACRSGEMYLNLIIHSRIPYEAHLTIRHLRQGLMKLIPVLARTWMHLKSQNWSTTPNTDEIKTRAWP